jgi:glycerol-3-phosphate acyltransferase PlsY
MARIFISYRRDDSKATAGRIAEKLVDRFGAGNITFDVESLPYAVDFRDSIVTSISGSDLLVAVIGRGWLGMRDDDSARIADDIDHVRAEIELALQYGVPILPVLVDSAPMPSADQLPDSIKALAPLNAATLDTGRDFRHHMAELIATIDGLLSGHVRRVAGMPGRPPLFSTATLREPATWIGLAACLAPIAAAFTSFAPTTSLATGAAALAAIGALVAFATTAVFLRHATSASRKRTALIAAFVMCATWVVYLWALSAYTIYLPGVETRIARGLTCTEQAQLVYGKRCPDLDLDQLKEAEYVATRLWSAGTIAMVSGGLVALWVLGFVSVAVTLSAISVRDG